MWATRSIDPEKRAGIEAALDAARTAIESALGDSAFYDQATWETPNCIPLAPITG